jgi:hypothetical protein
MRFSGRTTLGWMLGLFLVGLCFVPTSSVAQPAVPVYSELALDGEPTNPEEIVGILASHGVDLDDYDLPDAPPADEEAVSWFLALLDLLRDLLPQGGGGS